MKVVLNRDYGGFGLSNKAFKRIIDLGFPYIHQSKTQNEDFSKKDLKIIVSDEPGDSFSYKYKILENDYEVEDLRSHPLIVQVVKELGERAWGNFAKLEVVEIPDGIDWYIVEKNGVEWIIDLDTEERVVLKRS